MNEKQTTKEKILDRLFVSQSPLAIHEFCIPGVSENSIGSRLPEMAKMCLVVGRKRDEKPFKEWTLFSRVAPPLPLMDDADGH